MKNSNEHLEEEIRKICTYHSDESTSGYSLSEEQFQKLFDLFRSHHAHLKKEHAIKMAAAESNHDQLKTYYEGVLAHLKEKVEKHVDLIIKNETMRANYCAKRGVMFDATAKNEAIIIKKLLE